MSGVLPKNWVSAEIGLVCHLVNGTAFKPSDWTDEGMPIVRIQNLNNPEAPYNYFNGEVAEKFLIDSGALLFAWSGTPGTSFGAHIWNGGPAVLNQHIFKVVVDEKRIDKNFVRYAINQKLQELIGKAHGGAGLRHITKRKFEQTEIRLPPTNEQHRIVKKTDALLERSRRTKEALVAISALLDQYRQSVLLAAFRGDLTADWRESRDNLVPIEKVVCQLNRRCLENAVSSSESTKITALSNTSKERASDFLQKSWAYIRLEKLASSFNYGSSKKSSPSGKVPVLRMGNIQNGELDWSNLVYTSDSAEIRKYSLTFGDVLFNRTNSPELVGKTAVYHSRRVAVYAGYLIRIRTFDELDPEFLTFCLNSPMGRDYCWHVKSDGVSQSNINAKKLAAFEVPLCSKEEQRIIVHRIKNLFSVIENVRHLVDDAISKNTVLTNSILAKAFRGELVSQDPTDEPANILLEHIRLERKEKENLKRASKSMEGKKMAHEKSRIKTISVLDALKQANIPLSAQDLLVQAGYPNDVATDQLELFFLEVREQLNEGAITCNRRGEEDIFALAG